MTTRWLITGGCGFIGTNLVEALMQSPQWSDTAIRIVDNCSTGQPEDLGAVCDFEQQAASANLVYQLPDAGRVQLVQADILDADMALRVSEGCDIICHLAANTGVPKSVADPRTDCETNVFGILNYLEAARHNDIARFVFASSGAPAGEIEPPIHEEVVPHPVSPYGASKLAGEAYCSAWHQTYGVGTVALRFSNVYGPRATRKESVVAKFIRLATTSDHLEIYGDGNQSRDFIYIEDLVGAVMQAAYATNAAGELYQIATSRETTINELLEILLPALAQRGYAEIDVRYTQRRLGDVMRNYSDTSKAKAHLDWSATTDLKTGINKTLDWYFQ